MKKLFAIMLAVVMVVSMVAVLAACNPETPTEELSEVKKAIAAAEKMTLTQLEKAAEDEFKAANVKFSAQTSTSGINSSLSKFKEKYTWFDYVKSGSQKDSELLQAVQETVVEGSYWTDFALLQQGAGISSYVMQGYLNTYVPYADDEVNVQKDASGLVAMGYADKLFQYNKANYTTNTLTNVWQLTGKDGANGKKAMPAGLSFQNPTTEVINFAFLAMMTSESSCAKLADAYQKYFGTAYQAQEGYTNIGYYFVHEFIQNISAQHSSDTTIASTTMPADQLGTVYVIGFNKMKSYPTAKTWQDEIYLSGVKNNAQDSDNHLEGFDGFSYGFYMTIPETTRLPYTSCLVARYLLTEEGFKAGWSDPGYYSANTKIAANGGYALNTATIMEDPVYVRQIQFNFRKYVANELAELAKKK